MHHRTEGVSKTSHSVATEARVTDRPGSSAHRSPPSSHVAIRRAFALLLVVASLLGSASPAMGQGIIVAEPPVCEGGICPPVSIGDQLTVRRHAVDVTIEEQVATTSISQTFVNPNPWEAEGIYLFPIPEGAAVSAFTMVVDGVPIEAELLDAETARAIYERIVAERRDPALLEYAGRAALRASIFPIPPGGEREVRISYDQVLLAVGGLVRYVYPLGMDGYSVEPVAQTSVRVTIQTAAPIQSVYSPTHPIALDRKGPGSVVAGWEASDAWPSGDFTLFYSQATDGVGASVLSYYDTVSGEGHFLLLASPGIEQQTTALAKDVVVVLDTSGSMEGEKLAQAKAALTYVLGRLNPEDRFAVVEFSTGVRVFDPELRPASGAPEAIDWVQRLVSSGGTDIDGALRTGLGMVRSERPTTLLFLTDGLPTEGETDVASILDNTRAAAPENVRLFAFGVGVDVDTTLLDTIASENRGLSTYVRPGESLDATVETFWAKVGSPVLVDLSLTIDGVSTSDMHPAPLPDLYADGQLVVAGRYRQGGPATVTLRGTVNGTVREYIFDDVSLSTAGGDAFVPRLWATRRIGYLLQQIRLGGEDPELVRSVVDLSVRYGIVTPYTSYLITEDDILTQSGRNAAADADMRERDADPAQTSGQAAVDEAAAGGDLARAESAPVPGADATGRVRYVGARTFIDQDGVWVETTYDADLMTTVTVVYGSDEYFRLATERPDLASAFALGSRVIAIDGGIAYEVVDA
ncbi:MAG: VIT and VWA domain-containing protein [Chloroflexota bacterium]|nr:VIT and VWA domain-containing protein [Chloroflexota bacterium]